MSIIKGQFFRVKLDGLYLAASQSCTIHKSAELEESSHKDATGLEKKHEVVAIAWDGSANGLVEIKSSDDPDDPEAQNGFDLTELVGQTVDIEYTQTKGEMNRVTDTGGVKYTGKAIVNDCTLEFPDRQNSKYSIQFTGVSKLAKGTA